MSDDEDEGGGNLEMSDDEWGALICEDVDGGRKSCKGMMSNVLSGEDSEANIFNYLDAMCDSHCEMDEVVKEVPRHPRDPTYAHGEDSFCDTGFLDESDVAKHSFGVRGPQSVSVLFPHDSKKLLQVSRCIRDVSEVNAHVLPFMLDALRCEADFVHEDLFYVCVSLFLICNSCIDCYS